jgi:gliding motility-associated-like protein
VPNTFSPNGDGRNDVFYPMGQGISQIKSFRIFNRWGELVFERANLFANDPTAGWDGTYKGKQLTPDVYVYIMVVLCFNNENIELKGNVTLLK